MAVSKSVWRQTLVFVYNLMRAYFANKFLRRQQRVLWIEIYNPEWSQSGCTIETEVGDKFPMLVFFFAFFSVCHHLS